MGWQHTIRSKHACIQVYLTTEILIIGRHLQRKSHVLHEKLFGRHLRVRGKRSTIAHPVPSPTRPAEKKKNEMKYLRKKGKEKENGNKKNKARKNKKKTGEMVKTGGKEEYAVLHRHGRLRVHIIAMPLHELASRVWHCTACNSTGRSRNLAHPGQSNINSCTRGKCINTGCVQLWMDFFQGCVLGMGIFTEVSHTLGFRYLWL